MKSLLIAALAGAALALPATAAAPAPAESAASTYRINPGDVLDIYVWGDARLQRDVTVLPDGTISFPLAGTINAAGRTTTDVEQQLAKLLAPQYKGVDQQVTVSVKSLAGMQIAVIGKVKAPGNVSPTRYLNLIGALALAGGPTDFADVGNIVIIRQQGGRAQIIKTHVGSILKGKPSPQDIAEIPQVMAGDTVVVP